MAKQDTGKHTPLRPLRIPADEWEALGEAVGERERTQMIRKLIRWYMRWPASTLPPRPAQQVGGPGVSRKASDGEEPKASRA